jgi:hypothetical protein
MASPNCPYKLLLVQPPNVTNTSSLFMPPIATPNVPSFPQLKKPKTVSVKFVSSNLGEKLVGDVLVAAGVTFGASPFITVVDKAIVQRAAGSHTLLSSASDSLKTMARNPVAYIKSPFFLLMWGVYGATYATANSLKTIVEHQEHYKEESRQENVTEASYGKMGIFIGTTIVNSGTSLLKDKTYAKMFGTTGAASSMPLITYGLWATRDLMVVGSSFVLPDLVATKVQEQTDWNKADALKFSQLTVPIATQFLVGPIQLLGLDFYNRPLRDMGYRQASLERIRFLAGGYWSVVAARVARIAPAYSIGGVYNTKFRDAWRDRLIQKEIRFLESSQDTSSQKQHANRLVGLVRERHPTVQ